MKIAIAMVSGFVAAQVVGVTLVAQAHRDEAPKAEKSFYTNLDGELRECRVKTDTNCVVRKYGHVGLPDTIAVIRFVDEGQFCMQVRLPGRESLRCENYWPFNSPIVNADQKQ